MHIAGSAGLDVGLPDIPSSSHQIIARLIIVMELEEIIGNRAPRVGGGRALPRYSSGIIATLLWHWERPVALVALHMNNHRENY